MKDDILNFEVHLFSPDGVNSPVAEYLVELAEKDLQALYKCTSEIIDLPKLIFSRHKDIKTFKVGSQSFFELKVRYKNNAFRFFFVMEKPNVIIIYGFTKKTQKTEQKDIKKGLQYLGEYKNTKFSIPFKQIIDNL